MAFFNMSDQLEESRGSTRIYVEAFHPSTLTTAIARPVSPHLALPPLNGPTSTITTAASFFTGSSTLPTQLRASVNNTNGGVAATIPLDKYRLKLEECAALHRAVETLTQQHDECQRRLAEEKATNAQLRAVIAELRLAKLSKNEDDTAATERILEALSPALLSLSPTVNANSSVNDEAQLTFDAPSTQLPAEKRTSLACEPGAASHHACSSSNTHCAPRRRTVQRASLLVRLKPTSAGSAVERTVTSTVISPPDPVHEKPAQRCCSLSSSSSSTASPAHTPRSASSSRLQSGRGDTSVSEGVSESSVSPTHQRPSGHVSVADAAAYGRAMSEILEAPLGPWRE